MDVRCDRCQTEYELDDRSVTDAGASVQCTSCGHTFIVSRQGVTQSAAATTPPRTGGTPATGVAQTDPSPADWLLATEEGQTHRFRDLSTLHKWIVERKVTREDRISQKGGPWRQLGDLLDLAPFFEVVAQADRARAAEPTTQFQRPVTPSGETPIRTLPTPVRQAARTPTIPAADDDEDSDLYTSGNFPRVEVTTRVTDDPLLDDDDFGSLRPATHRGAKIATGLLVVVGLAAIAAYAGFKQPNWLPSFIKRTGPVPAASETTAAAPPAPTIPPPAAAAPPVASPPPAAAATPPPAAVAVAPPAPPPVAEPAAAAHVASAGPGGTPAPAAAPAPAAKPKTYDRLIADADRLLENGQPGKAQKLYEEALAMQPNGVAALTGQAYVLLDREKVMSAIATFRRALAAEPDYPPAVFGLAEAFRAQGENAQAIETYKRYLAVAPSGADAPAARGQIKSLEAGPARRAEPPSPTATIPADPTTPPAATR
jgi:predicted Zn finger-like uncharacterized protein